jgi:hypothetical protein
MSKVSESREAPELKSDKELFPLTYGYSKREQKRIFKTPKIPQKGGYNGINSIDDYRAEISYASVVVL